MRNGHTLALTAGELTGAVMGAIANSVSGQHLIDAFAAQKLRQIAEGLPRSSNKRREIILGLSPTIMPARRAGGVLFLKTTPPDASIRPRSSCCISSAMR